MMKSAKKHTVHWLILAALGIFLIVGHNLALNIVTKIIAVALILTAAGGVAGWWKTKSRKMEDIASLIGSAVFCLIGIWILLNTNAFITLINVVLGLLIAISSGLGLYRAWKTGFKLPMILSAVGVVLGLIIACNNAATTWMTVAEGIGLLYAAVTGFLAERS